MNTRRRSGQVGTGRLGFRYCRRINLGRGLGLNVSKSGLSTSYRTKFGSIGSRGFSVRTGIPGLSYRGGGKSAGAAAAFVALVSLAAVVISALAIVAWKILIVVVGLCRQLYQFAHSHWIAYRLGRRQRMAIQVQSPHSGTLLTHVNISAASGSSAPALPGTSGTCLVARSPLATGTSKQGLKQVEFDANASGPVRSPERRCPCLLLLDISDSMTGRPIQELNSGLCTLQFELSADSLASRKVDLAIVTFGPVRIQTEFTSAQSFSAPHLSASGDKPMGEAIERGLDLLRARKEDYRKTGVPYYRPWVFLIADGAPTDTLSNAKALIASGEAMNEFIFYTVGTEGSNLQSLAELQPIRSPLKLKDLAFGELFRWLSSSLSAVSRSNPGEAVPLQNPTSPEGWATVS
jgi:uncharacterized protein YegL